MSVCGTPAGYDRHIKAKEAIDEPCRIAYNARRRAQDQADRAGAWRPKRMTPAEYLHELEFLLQCGEGEHAILTALDTDKSTLERRLSRYKRLDLIPRIFNYVEQ